MAINYSQLRSLTARELISALARDGFVLDRHPDGRRVTVSFHRPGGAMIELQAHWTEEHLQRLNLIR